MRASQPPHFRRSGVPTPFANRPHWLRSGLEVPTSFLEQFANNPQTTLVSNILPDDSSFQLVDGSAFSFIGFFRTIIDGEIIGVGARSGNWLSVLTRGAENTARASHSAGAAVTQILTAGGMVQGITDRTTNNGLTLIQEKFLTGDTAVVSFQGIPQTFRHLQLVCYGRLTTAGQTDVYLEVRFNNDASASYDFEQLRALAASPASASVYGATEARIGDWTAASATTATQAASAILFVPNYAQASLDKVATSTGGAKYGTSGSTVNTWQSNVNWRNQSPINRIDLLPDPSVGGNIAAGSLFSLYGMR